MTEQAPSTWHHGLVADYWAVTNLDTPELELYSRYLRSPVLDAGCGTGRLLAPLRERGFDVDGCDASADMVERCRQRVADATLWVSALHEHTRAGRERARPASRRAHARRHACPRQRGAAVRPDGAGLE